MSEREADKVDVQAETEKARIVREAHADELMKKANVVGVGVGLLERGGERTQTVAVVVMVKQKVPRAQLSTDDIIPTHIEGIPVDVKEVGEVRAQQ